MGVVGYQQFTHVRGASSTGGIQHDFAVVCEALAVRTRKARYTGVCCCKLLASTQRANAGSYNNNSVPTLPRIHPEDHPQANTRLTYQRNTPMPMPAVYADALLQEKPGTAKHTTAKRLYLSRPDLESKDPNHPKFHCDHCHVSAGAT